MTQKTQKIISTFLVASVAFAGLEVLAYLMYLNQPAVYWQIAFWIFLYLVFHIVFLFDLHFKKRGSWGRAQKLHKNVILTFERLVKILFSALWDRFEHLRSWEYLRQWLHFLLLPGFIFWATSSLLYVNFTFIKIQQTLIVLSSVALIFYYWYLKEVFARRKEIVDSDIFIVLSVVKIYTVGLLYAASLSMLRFYCLPAWYFSVEVFCYTFLLIYQALYQHRLVMAKHIGTALLISAAMAVLAQAIYINWGYNYFTAAVFMAAVYNLFWGTFHYKIDKILTPKAFLEILFVAVLISAMVFSVTNFQAKIEGACKFALTSRVI